MDIICVRTENVQAAYTPVHLYVFYEWGLHKMLRPENVHPPVRFRISLEAKPVSTYTCTYTCMKPYTYRGNTL